MTRSEAKKKYIRLMNQGEQIRQQFLVKGLDVATTAKAIFLSNKDGKRYKAVRKFADRIRMNS